MWLAAWILLAWAVAAALAAPAWSQERGYVARACGLDMNRNRVIGEPADCNVCDGGPNNAQFPATGTPDPDGDGVNEDLIYVDATTGSDVSGTGSALAPYRTIQHAWDQADGDGDGAEDIVCFRGVTVEQSLTPPIEYRGVPTSYTVTASGSEKRDWRYPRNPAMLVGWDYDNDGCYPPFDDGASSVAACNPTADVAVIDATPTSLYAFELERDVSHLEVAHLEINDFGYGSNVNGTGFIRFSSVNTGHEYLYFHDLELHNVNRQRNQAGNVIAFDLYNCNLHWVNFTNLLFTDNGGWFARGVPHNGELGRPDAGPLRWKNVTRIMRGPNGQSTSGFKVWGYVTGVEVLDSVWDMNIAGGVWTPAHDGGGTTKTFIVVQCNQDWVIRNNEVIDSYAALIVQGASNGFCDNGTARPVDDVVFDRNFVHNSYDLWGFGHFGVLIEQGDATGGQGDAPGETIADVVVTNNFLASTGDHAWDACIAASAGNNAAPPPGQIVIANNTCVGPIRRDSSGALMIGTDPDVPNLQTFMQQSYVVKNNVVTGLDLDDNNVITGYLPLSLDSDHNVFDAAGQYLLRIGAATHTLAGLLGWRGLTGGDFSSAECVPSFVNPAAGNYHLTPTDSCARNAGEDLSGVTVVDVENDHRPQQIFWDIGADEMTEEIFADDFESGGFGAWSAHVP